MGGDYPRGAAGDYTPREALDIRADNSLRAGDKYVESTSKIAVNYDLQFDKFASNVAHAFRFKMVYRTDGGRIARGLVRASRELQMIHRAYWGAHWKQGDTVHLKAHFFRRRDPVATGRWVMLVRFVATDLTFVDVDLSDATTHAADEVAIAKARCGKLDPLLGCVTLSAQAPRFKNDIRTKRILAMIDIAEKAGCDQAQRLWYYNRAAAFDYFTWRTNDAKRKTLSAATGGRLPFDGYTFPHGEWRHYPFAELLNEFASRDLSTCDGAIWNRMVFFEDQISRTFYDIIRELDVAGNAIDVLNQLPNGASAMYGDGQRFLEHLKTLQKDPKHLYFAFR
jgi:hypothetical protein